MRLGELMDGNPITLDREISGLTADSRAVKPGFLFAALPGLRADGRHYIADALARGATAVLAPPGVTLPADTDAALLTDPNPRRCLAQMAARFFGAQPRIACAVTGTNGKTSVTRFTEQIWNALGRRAASIGTLGLSAPAGATPGSLTTPDPVALHKTLATLARDGVDRLVMEASSHGIEQCRLDGIRFAAAAFTNLTRDHLDYHGSMEAYRAAKLRLFAELLPPNGVAVLNADADDFDAFAAVCRERGIRVLTYGHNGRDIRILATKPDQDRQMIVLELMGRQHETEIALPGAFQAGNAACALGLAIASGEDPEKALAVLPRIKGARGRLELVARHPSGALIYVDYAHTPDALATVLKALRPHVRSRLIVVFGCGGDRDPGKRPIMGEIACALADRVIVTDDNPRSEDPASIRQAILAACATAREIGDRAEAIRTAVGELGSGDVLLIAGKGHETGQIVGRDVRPFDDATVAREAVGGRG